MEERLEGIVVEAEGDLVKVRIKHHGECSHCGACGGDLAMLVEARCEGGAAAGDKVLVEIPESKGLKAAFVVFLLPLAGAGAGWGAGLLASKLLGVASQWPSIALCAAFVAASLLFVRRYDRLLAESAELPVAKALAKSNASDTTKRD